MGKFNLKYFLFFLLLGTICKISTAQNSKNLSFPQAIDSLKNILKNETDDTNKVTTLNLLSEKLEKNCNYDTSLICANSAQILANKLGFKKGISGALFNIGQVYQAQNDYAKALEYILKALTIDQEIGNKKGCASDIGNIGIIYANQGHISMALEYYNKALAINREIGNKKGIAMNYGNIGNIYLNQSNYPKAFECYFKALATFRELGNKYFIALVLGNIGNIYYLQGNYPQALEYDIQSLTINKETGNKLGLALELNSIGNIYYFQGNYPQALEYDLQALNINQEVGNKHGTTIDLCNIGNIFNDQGNFQKALEYYLKALAKAQEIGDKITAESSLSNIGNVYYALRNYSLALEYWSKALTKAQEIGKKDDIAINLNNIGNIYTNQGNYTKALEYCFKALAITREIGDKVDISKLYNDIGDIYTKQKKYSTAKKILDSALAISQNIGDKKYTENVYASLALYDSATGNYKNAFEDYKKSVIYHDSLINKSNNKKIVQAEMNFEFEQKQAADKAEQNRNDLIAEQKRKKEAIIRNSIIAISSILIITIIAGLLYINYNRKLRSQQQKFSRQLILNIDDERKRISINLHDDIGQLLSIIKSKIIRSNTLQTSELNDLENDVGHIIEHTRNISKELYPSALEKIGLLRYIASFMENIQSATGMECSFEISDKVNYLPIATQAQVARIIQECTNNTIKHSGATGLKISIYEKDKEFTLIYQDNGKGLKSGINYNGIGLLSIHERGRILNGAVTIDEKNENGFYLILKFKENNIVTI